MQDFVIGQPITPGRFRNPTNVIGPALNRIVRNPAAMTIGGGTLAFLAAHLAEQNYNEAELEVFNRPGRDIERRIEQIWHYTNSLIDQYPVRASPEMIAAAMRAEANLRSFAVDHFIATGERYTDGFTVSQQAPLNNLHGNSLQSIRGSMRTRADARDLLLSYADFHGVEVSSLGEDKIVEILTSESPMDIAPGVEVNRPRPLSPEEAGSLVAVAPSGDNVRVTGVPPPQLPCRIDEYRNLRGKCGPNRQAHHIIPDYTKRYGNRAEGERGIKRIPGLPGFGQGMAICLTGHARSRTGQHGVAHRTTDPLILAQGATADIPGTTTFVNAALAGAAGAIAARPECATVIVGAVNAEIAGRRPGQLVNANPSSPPVPPALNALMSGQ